MSLISVVVILIFIGVLLWLVNNYIPMDRKIKSLLNIIIFLAVVIWLLQTFGIIGSLSNFKLK